MGNQSKHKAAPETAFRSFREEGDAAALGRVFNLVAAELHAVARGVSRSGEAEDLVQATFLTAIERAQTWDDTRPLVPWLLGILVHHARSAKRMAARSPELDRLWSIEPTDPLEAAGASEVRDALSQAMGQLSHEDRAVLEPVLHRDAKPFEIAAVSGVAPGTVRMRLSRALKRLRDRLPAGVALPVLFPLPFPDELRPVRARVLERAARSTGTAVLAPTGLLPTVLTLAMSPKFLLAPAAILLLSLGWWLRQEALEPGKVAPAAANQSVAIADAPRPGARLAETPSSEVLSELREPIGVGAAALEFAKPALERGRVIGRILDSGGSPLADTQVSLLEVGGRWIGSGLFPQTVDPDSEVGRSIDRTRTDAEGRFELESGASGKSHFLGVGFGTSRSGMLAVEATATKGSIRDLGDLALPRFSRVTGRVVDMAGSPLAGVEVRTLQTSERVGLPFEYVGDEFQVLLGNGESTSGLLEPSSFLVDFFVKGSTALAVTDAEGRFEIAAELAQQHSTWLRAPGYGALELEPQRLSNVELELGDLVLSEGVTIEFALSESGGGAVRAAEVWWGVSGSGNDSGVSVVVPAGGCDHLGRLALRGLPRERTVVLAIQRAGEKGWTAHRFNPAEVGEALSIELSPPVSLDIELHDETGALVEGGEVILRPARLAAEFEAFGLVRAPVHRADSSGGSYRFEGLLPGKVWVQGWIPGYPLIESEIEIPKGVSTHEVSLKFPESHWSIEVVDGASGIPIQGARVDAMQSGIPDSTMVSDGEGRAAVTSNGARRGEPHLLVQHPEYATKRLALDGTPRSMRVELDEGAELVVRAFDDKGRPHSNAQIQLQRLSEGRPAARVWTPMLAWTDEAGQANFKLLEPGEWLVSRRSAGRIPNRPFEWLIASVEMSETAVERLSLRAGERRTIQIGGLNSPEYASVEGSFLVEGGVLTGTGALLASFDESWTQVAEPQRIELEPSGGEYRFEGLEPGHHILVLMGRVEPVGPIDLPLKKFELKLAPGEGIRQDLRVDLAILEVEVVDETGLAVAGADIRTDWNQFIVDAPENAVFHPAVSDKAGRARIPVNRGWTPTLLASHSAYGVSPPVELTPGQRLVTIVLPRGIPIQGRLLAPADSRIPEEALCPIVLQSSASAGAPAYSGHVNFVEGVGTLDLRVNDPGDYDLLMFVNTVQYQSAGRLEVPAEGVLDVEVQLDLPSEFPGRMDAPVTIREE